VLERFGGFRRRFDLPRKALRRYLRCMRLFRPVWTDGNVFKKFTNVSRHWWLQNELVLDIGEFIEAAKSIIYQVQPEWISYIYYCVTRGDSEIVIGMEIVRNH